MLTIFLHSTSDVGNTKPWMIAEQPTRIVHIHKLETMSHWKTQKSQTSLPCYSLFSLRPRFEENCPFSWGWQALHLLLPQQQEMSITNPLPTLHSTWPDLQHKKNYRKLYQEPQILFNLLLRKPFCKTKIHMEVLNHIELLAWCMAVWHIGKIPPTQYCWDFSKQQIYHCFDSHPFENFIDKQKLEDLVF